MTTLLKLGGELLEDDGSRHTTLEGIVRLAASGPLVIVHGGGRAIDADLRARGIAPHFVDGLRVTDADTLASVVGVLAGGMNTSLVAALNAAGLRAVGLTAADAGVARTRAAGPLVSTSGTVVDLGLVGTPDVIEPVLLRDLLALGYLPVVACVGAGPDGRLLNVNADVLAAHLAAALRVTRLIVAGSTPGVLNGDGTPLASLNETEARALIEARAARDGMVAKLGACMAALEAGVDDVRIVSGRGGDFEDAPGTRLLACAVSLGQ